MVHVVLTRSSSSCNHSTAPFHLRRKSWLLINISDAALHLQQSNPHSRPHTTGTHTAANIHSTHTIMDADTE